MENQDVSVMVGEYLFNYRVSAIINNKNKILIHHSIKENHITLPGGRIKEGENSIEALRREFKEEMGQEIEYVKPYSLIENFFTMNNKKYHEVLITHEVRFKNKDVYNLDKIETIEKGKKDKLEFIWVDIDQLKKMNFIPKKLKELVVSRNDKFVHLINDDRK